MRLGRTRPSPATRWKVRRPVHHRRGGPAVELWMPTGRGLLRALRAAWRAGEADPFDAARHNPAFALPVYTRLSDAEENERIRLAKNDPKNLAAGVQDVAPRRDQRASMHDTAILNARPAADGIVYKPLDAAHAAAVAALEAQVMGSDAWNEHLVADELPRPDRIWWAAYDGEQLLGYAGGWVVDGQVQILKVGVDPAMRRRGIARELLAHVAADARDLGASRCSLEVRAGNVGAQELYAALGFAMRPCGRRRVRASRASWRAGSAIPSTPSATIRPSPCLRTRLSDLEGGCPWPGPTPWRACSCRSTPPARRHRPRCVSRRCPWRRATESGTGRWPTVGPRRRVWWAAYAVKSAARLSGGLSSRRPADSEGGSGSRMGADGIARGCSPAWPTTALPAAWSSLESCPNAGASDIGPRPGAGPPPALLLRRRGRPR